MDDRKTLIYCLVGGVLCTASLVLWLWRRRAISVGLPFCYLFSLAMIHFIGAGAHILPWNQLLNTHEAAVGFQECFYGVLAFVVGVFVVEMFVHGRHQEGATDLQSTPEFPVRARGSRLKRGSAFSLSRNRSTSPPRPEQAALGDSGIQGSHQAGEALAENPAQPGMPGRSLAGRKKPALAMRRAVAANRASAQLPGFYILVGLLCAILLVPVLSRIPSIGAVANCGTYLVVGGLCLVCWRHWQRKEPVQMLVWMACCGVFPVFTMLTMGFLGFGVYAAVMLLIFVSSYYRPRWQLALGLGLLLYFGLSVFVTYMRDRSDFRDSVWGGESYVARVEKAYSMFSQFEWFDPHEDRHLDTIDGRLNQNYLVGLAVENLQSGGVPFANGSTLANALLSVVPRIFWPGKPVRAGSPQIVSQYTGLTFAEHTSVGVGQVMEFYINFGRWGILGGFFCFGLIIRWLDWKAAVCLHRGDDMGFVRWFLPALAFMLTGGSLVEVVGTFAASTVLVLTVNYYLRSTSPGLVQEDQPVLPFSRPLET